MQCRRKKKNSNARRRASLTWRLNSRIENWNSPLSTAGATTSRSADLQTVGHRYAVLDELKAKITEARAKQNPHNQDVREQARQARSQAQESARAVGEENVGVPSPDDAALPAKPKLSERLRNLYRQAAKVFHPDMTLDGEEKKKRHRLMGEISDARRAAMRGADSGLSFGNGMLRPRACKETVPVPNWSGSSAKSPRWKSGSKPSLPKWTNFVRGNFSS